MAAKPKALSWPQNELDKHEISAIKAMAGSHPMAFEALIGKLCLRDRASFELGLGHIDGSRMTDFNEGRRYVGNTLRAILALQLSPGTRGAPPDLPNSPTSAPGDAGAT